MAFIAHIPSSSTNIIYEVVSYPSGKMTCTCPGFTHRKYCKHIEQVKDLIPNKTNPTTSGKCSRCGKNTGDNRYPYCNQCEWIISGGTGLRPTAHLENIPEAEYSLTDKFYGRVGSDDPTRERYVNQQKVTKGKLPNGKIATQEGSRWLYSRRIC